MTTLATSERGSVSLCRCRKAISVDFGPLSLRLSPSGFSRLREFVLCVDVEYCEVRNEGVTGNRVIAFELSPDGISARLTREEFEDLRGMIDAAFEEVMIGNDRCWTKESMN